jgi:hypothetical protein
MALWGLAALLSIAPAAAADRVLGPTGAIHSITVENRYGVSDFNALPYNGTRLLYRMQSSEEAMQSVVIPGTDESIIDSEPTILLSPLTFRPVIVWTRNESTEAEINFSFYNGTTWSSATALTENEVLDRHPQIFWGSSGYLHIVWTGASELDSGPLMYEAVLDSKGLVMVPPSPILTVPGQVVTTSTSAPATLDPSDVLFAVDTSHKLMGRVTVQGGLDEPVPVHKRVDFMLPAGLTVESAKIEVVNGRILVLIKSGSKMYYSYESPYTGWTTLRTVTLEGATDERGAEILIRTMLQALDQ